MQVAQRELTERLPWLCGLRWLAAAGIVTLTLGAAYVLHFPLPVTPLLVTGMVVAAYNLLLYAWIVALRQPTGLVPLRLGTALAHLQIMLDLVALTGVIHFTGGIESPLGGYLVFHMVIASTLLQPLAALGQALFASCLYGGLVFLEATGRLPHYSLGFAPPGFYRDPAVVWPTLALLSVLYGSIYLATSIVQRLRQRERQLSELTEQMEQEKARTEMAYEQTQAAQLMQLRYMYRVSHELRRPLSAAASLLKVILDGLVQEQPDARTTDMLRRAYSRLQQGLDLVVDLLALSQAREAPLREPRVWLDLTRLLEQAADEMADFSLQQGVTLELDLERHLGPVWAQPEGLTTVVRNLLANAIKYTPPGGRVVIRATQDGAATHLAISDTGIGIAPDDLPRIFEEFFRSPQAREYAAPGTGLGLAIVKTIVEANGGEVRVSSRLGEGSTFEVILPHHYPEMDSEGDESSRS